MEELFERKYGRSKLRNSCTRLSISLSTMGLLFVQCKKVHFSQWSYRSLRSSWRAPVRVLETLSPRWLWSFGKVFFSDYQLAFLLTLTELLWEFMYKCFAKSQILAIELKMSFFMSHFFICSVESIIHLVSLFSGLLIEVNSCLLLLFYPKSVFK